MTWSSTGSAATYPTVIPGSAAGGGSALGFVVTLTLRLDPDSGIVYVTGQWYTNGGNGTGTGPIHTKALPQSFRPQQDVTLYPVAGGTVPTLIRAADGFVVATSNQGNTTPMILRHFYFTNVTPG